MLIVSDTLTKYHQTKDQLDQESLVITEAKKDPARFSVLYEKYYEQLFLFILKRVESEDTAADVCSQVFLKALSNISKYKDMGLPFSSWLFRIARNELYDLYKRNKIEMVLSTETKGIEEIVNEIGESKKEDHEHLYLVMGQLEEDEVELIELRFFEDRPFKEIGEILEITENNAKVRTYRVLDKLKKLLKHER